MVTLNKELTAPCVMNYGVCLHYLRVDNKYSGCFSERKVNGKCIKYEIELCKERRRDYCVKCAQYPCKRQLDKIYHDKL